MSENPATLAKPAESGPKKIKSKRNGKPTGSRRASPSEAETSMEALSLSESHNSGDKSDGNANAKRQGRKSKDTPSRDKKTRANGSGQNGASANGKAPNGASTQQAKVTLAPGDAAFAGSSFHESPDASSLPRPSFAKGATSPSRLAAAAATPAATAMHPAANMPQMNGQNPAQPLMMPMPNPHAYGHMPYMPMPMSMHPMAPPMGSPMGSPMGYHPMGAVNGMMAPHPGHPGLHYPMHAMPMYPSGMHPGAYPQPSLQQPPQRTSPDKAGAAR